MELRSDSFDFQSYLKPQTDEYKLDAPSKLSKDVVDMFYGEAKNEGALLPWKKTHSLLRLRPGEVTVWCGINGHGKSQVTGYVALDLIDQDERVCLMSFEMLPKRTLWRMLRQAAGTNEPSIRFIKNFLHWADKRLYLFNHQGTVSPELVLGTIRYGAQAHGIRHFVIDSLMKCSKGEDDYSGQKDFVDELCAIAREFGIHIHLVHHVRKTENEFQVPGKFDAKGSGAISDQVDNFIMVWRNKRKEIALRKNAADEKAAAEPDCVLNVDKQRNGEWEGQVGLWFHALSMAYVEHRGEAPKVYERGLEDVLAAA